MNLQVMKKIFLFIPIIFFASCHNGENDFDATGAFESVETIVSTEASGTIMKLNVEEGQSLKANQSLGYIDTIQLYLKKQQLEAQIYATVGQKPDIPKQIAALQAQLEEAQTNRKRVAAMYNESAATRQQMDDANSQVKVLEKEIQAQLSNLGITSKTLGRDITPLQRQIAQIDDQLKKCKIINPIQGTVLTKYAEAHEVAMPGKALYKIAETDTLILRAYITGDLLAKTKLGQSVNVRVDNGPKTFKNYTGVIYWISDKAEFTPKTIQTKEERADQVYAIKIRVVNDGYLKIGMYADMKLK
jgi:HlyD family secretion protein